MTNPFIRKVCKSSQSVSLLPMSVSVNHINYFLTSAYIPTHMLLQNKEFITIFLHHIYNKKNNYCRIPFGETDSAELQFRNDIHNHGTIENLNRLTFLNEPEILACLKARYAKNVFSCYFGPVLLHINPLRASVDTSDEILEKFTRGVKGQTHVPPVLWETASAVLGEIVKKSATASKSKMGGVGVGRGVGVGAGFRGSTAGATQQNKRTSFVNAGRTGSDDDSDSGHTGEGLFDTGTNVMQASLIYMGNFFLIFFVQLQEFSWLIFCSVLHVVR